MKKFHLLFIIFSIVVNIVNSSTSTEAEELNLQDIYKRYGRGPDDRWLSVLDESYSEGRYAGWQKLSACCSPGADVEEIFRDWFDDGVAVLMSEDGVTDPIEIAVAPPIALEAQRALLAENFNVTVAAEDVEELFAVTVPTIRGANNITETFFQFHEVEKFIDELVAKHRSEAHVRQIGKTENGTRIRMVIIKSRQSPGVFSRVLSQPPVVFVDAATHAREWLSVSTVLFLIQQLLDNPGSPARDVEWRIVPVVNPDGYIYSWEKNRLWRKNRRSSDGKCQGVDLNRNYDINFVGVGSSTRQCSYLYRGPSAFSEPETQAIRDAIFEVKSRLKGYIALHSYSQVILLPWAFKADPHPDIKNMTAMGEGIAQAIRAVRGTEFGVHETFNNFYPASGCSFDWASAIGVPYSMTMELHDKGKHGFLYPAKKIHDAVTEVWKGLEFFGKEIARQARLGYFSH
ncbi:Peptidase M14 carboxypeptidase A [Trinorchestia longiramus]|nr:Peptidase M14 carboxypeptidase A [Trinorchestia longiramus]